MSAQPTSHVIVSTVHINYWDDAARETVPGWEVKVRDLVSGSTVPVFVPDAVWGKAQAETLINAALATVRDVHSLTQ